MNIHKAKILLKMIFCSLSVVLLFQNCADKKSDLAYNQNSGAENNSEVVDDQERIQHGVLVANDTVDKQIRNSTVGIGIYDSNKSVIGICTGVIIDKKSILTAAHCFLDATGMSDIKIFMGPWKIENGDISGCKIANYKADSSFNTGCPLNPKVQITEAIANNEYFNKYTYYRNDQGLVEFQNESFLADMVVVKLGSELPSSIFTVTNGSTTTISPTGVALLTEPKYIFDEGSSARPTNFIMAGFGTTQQDAANNTFAPEFSKYNLPAKITSNYNFGTSTLYGLKNLELVGNGLTVKSNVTDRFIAFEQISATELMYDLPGFLSGDSGGPLFYRSKKTQKLYLLGIVRGRQFSSPDPVSGLRTHAHLWTKVTYPSYQNWINAFLLQNGGSLSTRGWTLASGNRKTPKMSRDIKDADTIKGTTLRPKIKLNALPVGVIPNLYTNENCTPESVITTNNNATKNSSMTLVVSSGKFFVGSDYTIYSRFVDADGFLSQCDAISALEVDSNIVYSPRLSH